MHLLARTPVRAAILGAGAPIRFLGVKPNPNAPREDRFRDMTVDEARATANIEKVTTPILILVGTADSLLPINRLLHDRLEKAGKKVRMEIYENGYHDFVMGPQGQNRPDLQGGERLMDITHAGARERPEVRQAADALSWSGGRAHARPRAALWRAGCIAALGAPRRPHAGGASSVRGASSSRRDSPRRSRRGSRRDRSRGTRPCRRSASRSRDRRTRSARAGSGRSACRRLRSSRPLSRPSLKPCSYGTVRASWSYG